VHVLVLIDTDDNMHGDEIKITLFYLCFFHMHPFYCSVFFVTVLCAVSVPGHLVLYLAQ